MTYYYECVSAFAHRENVYLLIISY